MVLVIRDFCEFSFLVREKGAPPDGKACPLGFRSDREMYNFWTMIARRIFFPLSPMTGGD